MLSRSSQSIDLSGQWEFALDPNDVGEQENYFNKTLANTIALPGSVAAQGFGDSPAVDTQWTGDILNRSWFTDAAYSKYREPGNIKLPFWLTPVKNYVGPAWYRTTVVVPSGWRDKRVVLFLERAHWTTRVWIDGKPCGQQDSLATSHEYDLGPLVPGAHQLAIRVDNRLHVAVGSNASSVTDHTQTNWNGIIGKIELRPRNPAWIDDLQVYPDVASRTARVLVHVRNTSGQPFKGVLRLESELLENQSTQSVGGRDELVDLPGDRITLERSFSFGPNARLWDEFSPAVYRMHVSLGEYSRSVDFGFREFKTRGTQFTINGRPTFLRGTLECAIFPLTGYPPTTIEPWARIMNVVKAHGLNHMRFHSWCPPEAAFAAADQAGVYLQIEAGAWPNADVVKGPGSHAGLGDGAPVDQWLMNESQRIVRMYGNHPSFVMMTAGNEPGGPKHAEYLANWVKTVRRLDPRRIYAGTSGWPELAENQYQVISEPRIQHWAEGLSSRINSKPPETMTDYREIISARPAPVVAHEIGQWCAYPDLASIGQYTGVTSAGNFEIFRDSLAEHHMLDQAHDFLIASGKLQAICYKEDIESALRTPGMGGFQLLDLHDFPGQGSALVGVLDPFWRSKGYISAEEYHRFASEVVPLVRLPKRVFLNNENLNVSAEIANFSAGAIENASPAWRLTDASGARIAGGQFSMMNIPVGNAIPLGTISASLAGVKSASKLTLSVELSGSNYRNSWEIWVYPHDASIQPPPANQPADDVMITRSLDEAALAKLNSGGKVLLLAPAGKVKGDSLGKVEIGFSPIFWNTAWTTRQAPHTLGIFCDPTHPALADFPTDSHTNWQWWDLITHSQAMILDALPPDSRPVVQVIDDWVTNRKLGLVVEASVNQGKLMICSIDLETDLDNRPAAKQLRASLLKYLASNSFDPKQTVEVETVRSLFAE